MDLPADPRRLVRRRGRPGAPDHRAGGGAGGGHPRAARRPRLDDAVASRAGPRPRRPPPGLPGRRPGELVPGAGHGALQRGGHRRRALRARQLPRLPAQPAPVDDADHLLRRPPGRRPRRHRLAGLGQGDAAQLDRTLAGRAGAVRVGRRRHRGLHHPPGHPVRRHVPRAGPRAPDGRRAGAGRLAVAAHRRGARRPLDRRRRHPGRRRRAVPQRRRVALGPRAPGGPRQDRCVHRGVGHQPGQRRGAARLRRRLRAHGLRHRRDHGRPGPGPARLGLRDRLRSADPPDRAAAGGLRGRGLRRRGRGHQLRERRGQPQRPGRRPRPRR